MPSPLEDLRARLRDPWAVAPLLILLITVLALAFPKPARVPEETDPERVRTPPPGMALALLAEPLAVTCQKAGDAAPKDCAMFGAEAGMVYSLSLQWDLTELRQAHKGKTLTVQGARLDLLENHQEHYTGPVRVLGADGSPLADGGRVDNRTLRAPLEGATSAALDAAIAQALLAASGRLALRVEPDPSDSSSVDEYVPVLSFFYRAE